MVSGISEAGLEGMKTDGLLQIKKRAQMTVPTGNEE